jgi:putative ABC transport system permease protein
MISIALRNLLAEKTRFAISAGGVAFSVMLILIILALYQGWQVKSTQYMREIETDIWVTQNGSSDLTSSASVIKEATGESLKQLPDVRQVSRFVGRPLQFDLNGEPTNTYIVGVDSNNPVTGPKHIVSGRGKPEVGEIVIDKVLADKRNLSLNDSLQIFGKNFRIVGIAEGANMFLFQFSFLDQTEASQLINLDSASTYYLVKTSPGLTERVVERINKLEGVDAFSKKDFIEENKRLIDEVFIPIIAVLVLISLLVGTAVIGLTTYTMSIEKSQEFGVLKALGANSLQVYRILFEQAMLSGVVGYFAGLGLTFLVLWLVPKVVPVFVTATVATDVVLVGFLSIFMSLVASYIPIRRILQIDPALVFKR